jgi:hypothetical protein
MAPQRSGWSKTRHLRDRHGTVVTREDRELLAELGGGVPRVVSDDALSHPATTMYNRSSVPGPPVAG